MLGLLRIVGRSLGPCIAAVVVKNVVEAKLRWRRRHQEDAIDDLRVLNSHALLQVPFPHKLEVTTDAERGGLGGRKTPKQTLLIRNHKTFVAQWARAAKGRFNFARKCELSPVNEAALHRWFTKEFKDLGLSLLEISYVIDDVIALSFEPTYSRFVSESKKVVRHRSRMEYYNEKKALQKIH